MADVPLPEPVALPPLIINGKKSHTFGYTPEAMHAHAAAVTAAKDAEIAALQIKADLLDLAVRKGLLSVHSELIDPRNHGTRCSWLEGHAKACDISNNARAALKKAP